MFPIDAFTMDYPNRKIVIVKKDNEYALHQCSSIQYEIFDDIPSQGYAIRTSPTRGPQFAINTIGSFYRLQIAAGNKNIRRSLK